jgi:hypothetical protein
VVESTGALRPPRSAAAPRFIAAAEGSGLRPPQPATSEQASATIAVARALTRTMCMGAVFFTAFVDRDVENAPVAPTYR